MQPQQYQQPTMQPTTPAPIYSQPIMPQQPQKKSKAGKILKIIGIALAIILLIGAFSFLSYLLYKENQTLKEKEAYIAKYEQVLRDADKEPAFRKVLQDSANRNCSTDSAIVFNTTTSSEKNSDGSVKKYFAVGQYVCNIGDQVVAYPVRFVAAQSYDGITWDFTYGSSTVNPVTLPKYIFDTDPALYNRKYNNPKSE